MFTTKALNSHIASFISAMTSAGFEVERAFLYGSYASGKPHEYSDIDVAIWLTNLPEKHYTEIPELLRIVTVHQPIRPKFYGREDNASTDGFIEVIKRTGREIKISRELKEADAEV